MSGSGQLVVVSKRLSALTDAALADGIRLEAQAAPGLLKQKDESDKTDLNKERQSNRAKFQP